MALTPRLRFPAFLGRADWTRDLLGSLFTEREEAGTAMLPLLSLTANEGVVPQAETNRTNNSSADKSNYLRVVPGDIVYNTMRMWEGRSALVGIEGLVSPAYTVCAPKNLVHSPFFAFYFKTAPLIRAFRRYSQGLVKDTLNLKFQSFGQISAPYPRAPAEQAKIADCLTSLDEVIAAQARKVEALKAYKRGLMQQLFPREGETVPRLRFSEFRDNSGWSEHLLGALCDGVASGRDAADPDGAFHLYGSTGRIGRTDSGSYDGHRILVARVGANAGLLTMVTGVFGATDNVLVIQTKRDVSVGFLFYALESLDLNRMSFGSGQPLITGGQLKEIHLRVPPLLEQEHVASFISVITDKILAESERVEILTFHKRGLMQQLFPAAERESA